MIPTDLAVLFSNLVGLFLLIGAGFLSVRTGVLPAQASKPFSALLLKITVPATIFAAMIRPFDSDFMRLGASVFLLGVVFFPLYAALSLPLSRLLRVPEGRRGMWCCCTTFCNNGFMGYPVAYALFGDEGLVLAVLLGIPFNLMVYSLGARMVCMDITVKRSESTLSLRDLLLTPINCAIVLSLIFYFAQLPVPATILTPIQHLSNVTTPLSMFVTGMNLAQGRVRDVVRDRDAITASAVRLLVFPVLTWALMGLLPGLDSLVFGVTLVIMAMPAPAVSTIMAEQYGGNTQLGARIVFLSSLLCIATIPLVSLLL